MSDQEGMKTEDEVSVNQLPTETQINEDSTELEDEYFSPEVELCKMLTGMDYEKEPEKVLCKMIDDRKSLSLEYGIPLPTNLEHKSLQEYCSKLINLAKEKEVDIKYVTRQVLDDNNLGGGMKEDGSIVLAQIDLEKVDQMEMYRWSVEFTHEFIHALQEKEYPDKSIEGREYEAYVVANLPLFMGNYPTSDYIKYYLITSTLFTDLKNSCIRHYNKKKVNLESISWLNSGTKN